MDERAAEDWWRSLDPVRKAQIHRWIEGGSHVPVEVEGQLPLPLPGHRRFGPVRARG